MCIFLVFLCNTLCPFWVCDHRDGETRTGCFALIVFLVSCDCFCSVTLPHGALGCLHCVIVVFPGHAPLLFKGMNRNSLYTQHSTITYMYLTMRGSV